MKITNHGPFNETVYVEKIGRLNLVARQTISLPVKGRFPRTSIRYNSLYITYKYEGDEDDTARSK
jgi:hypothetical protein